MSRPCACALRLRGAGCGFSKLARVSVEEATVLPSKDVAATDGVPVPEALNRQESLIRAMGDDTPALPLAGEAPSPPEAPSAIDETCDEILAAAAGLEPTMTAEMQEVTASANGRLDGLEFRLKGYSSLHKKLTALAKTLHKKAEDLSLEAAMLQVREGNLKKTPSKKWYKWVALDALRYTLVLSEADYAVAVTRVRETRLAQGGRLVEQKNFWPCPNTAYVGINDIYAVPTDALPVGVLHVEVQYHTEASLAQRDAQHGLFEIFRSGSTAQRMKAYALMIDGCNAVSRPPGAAQLPADLKRTPLSKHFFETSHIVARGEEFSPSALAELERREPVFQLDERNASDD